MEGKELEFDVCVDVTLPEYEPLGIADRLAVRTRKRWKPGRTLRVRFLGGDPAVHARVRALAPEWIDHAHLGLEFVDSSDADIRIAFGPGGSWSLVGSEARAIPSSKPTMNLGVLTAATSAEDCRRVVLHEFGHAMGCIHEHSSPASGINWNRSAVYEFYGRPPHNWSRARVDTNIFKTYSGDVTQFSQFDPSSIMIYPIRREFTLDGFEVGWNRTLSALDKEFIATVYPTPDATLTQLLLDASPLPGEIVAPGGTQGYRLDVAVAATYVVETTGTIDLAMELFGPDSRQVLVARDAGGGLGGNAKIEEFLLPGSYVVRVTHQRVRGTGPYQISVRGGA